VFGWFEFGGDFSIKFGVNGTFDMQITIWFLLFPARYFFFACQKKEYPRKKDTPDIKVFDYPRLLAMMMGTRLHDFLSWSGLSTRPVQTPLSLQPSSA
jgi:hypothetical protein